MKVLVVVEIATHSRIFRFASPDVLNEGILNMLNVEVATNIRLTTNNNKNNNNANCTNQDNRPIYQLKPTIQCVLDTPTSALQFHQSHSLASLSVV